MGTLLDCRPQPILPDWGGVLEENSDGVLALSVKTGQHRPTTSSGLCLEIVYGRAAARNGGAEAKQELYIGYLPARRDEGVRYREGLPAHCTGFGDTGSRGLRGLVAP